MIDVRREVINHIEVRWRDGFRPVSEAHGALADKLQELAAASKPARGELRIEVVTVRLDDGSEVPVGTLRLDVHVRSSSRELRYFHAAVFPAHPRVSDEAWRRLVESRYGDEPASRIQEAYEEVSTQSRDEGGSVLERFAIRDTDARLVLGPPPPAKKRASTVQPPERPRAVSLAALVGAVFGASLVLLLTFVCREPPPRQADEGADLARLRADLLAQREHTAALEKRLGEVTRLLEDQTAELKTCRGNSGGACAVERQELARAKDEVAEVTRQRDHGRTALRDALTRLDVVCRKVSPTPAVCKGAR